MLTSGRRIVVGVVLAAAVVALADDLITRAAFDHSLAMAEAITDNAIPSLDALTDLRWALFGLHHELATGHRPSREEQAHVHALVARYVALPRFPGEERLQDELFVALARVDEDEAVLNGYGSSPDAAAATARDAEAATGIVQRLIALNRTGARASAREVARTHEWANNVSLGLEAVSLILFAAMAVAGVKLVGFAQRLIEARMQELDAFAARAAHDLKGVLTPLVLGLGVLRNETLSERGRKTLERCETTLGNATTLVDGLLAFARAGAHHERGATGVEGALEGVLSALQPLAEDEGVALSIDLEEGLVVAVPGGVLDSIVSNLVRNAILHMGAGEERAVLVRVRGREDQVVLEVVDTGAGISPELLPHLFTPFRRGSTRPGGLGLGLATVKRLVEAFGGAVEVRSERGRGSTFTVRLPRAGARVGAASACR